LKQDDRANARPGEELGRVILHDARQKSAKYCVQGDLTVGLQHLDSDQGVNRGCWTTRWPGRRRAGLRTLIAGAACLSAAPCCLSCVPSNTAAFSRLQCFLGAEFAVALRQNVRLRANRSFDKQGHKLRMRTRRLRHCESAADIPYYEFTSNGHVFSVFPIWF